MGLTIKTNNAHRTTTISEGFRSLMVANLALFTLLAFIFPLQTSKSEESKDPDPLIGRWRWSDNQLVEFHKDGTMTVVNGTRKATWKLVPSESVERKYSITWEGGLYVDTVTMTKSNVSLKGKNQNKKDITGTKIPMPDREKDPILGRWQWIEEQIVDCRADGTFIVSPSNRKGTWEVADEKDGNRKYLFIWDQGQFVDKITMSKDQKSMKGENQEKKEIQAVRIADKK